MTFRQLQKTPGKSTGQSSMMSWLLATLVALGVGFNFPNSQAQAYTSVNTSIPFNYSCSNPHCAGQREFPGPNGGAVSVATVSFMSALGYQNTPNLDFIQNAIWVSDTQSNGCSYQHICWVEVGYSTFSNPNTSTYEAFFYFWVPPGGADKILELGDVTTSMYGQGTVLRADEVNANEFNVGVSYYPAEIIDISLKPNEYDIGLELAGTNGASASGADFTSNLYYDANLSGNAYPQQSIGVQNVRSPAYGQWRVPPNPSNKGGDFYTYCPC